MSDWVRSAENLFGYDANVFHVSSLDFTVGVDGVHLLGTSFQAQMARMQYVWNEAIKNGTYRRGPRITAFTFLGNTVTAALEYRQPGASDFTPTTGAVGFTVTDASGTPGVVSVTRQDATHPKITFDRALVAPVVAKFLSGGAPSTAAPIYDNATVPLPLVMESTLATTEGAPPADTLAPTLTSPTGTATGSTTASGSVTTDEAGGTLYYLANTSATATAAQVKAGSSKAVAATGSQSVSLTGLAASTQYYLHFLHADGAATPNESAVANTSAFMTAAAPDTTAPVLSAATATSTGPTTATGSVTTNEAAGTIYALATTSASATAAQVKAGISQAVSSTGAKSFAFTGLTAATVYYAHYLQRDAAATPNESAIVRSASFTTDAIPVVPTPGDIDATKVPPERRVVFEGGKRVVSFEGSIRKVSF